MDILSLSTGNPNCNHPLQAMELLSRPWTTSTLDSRWLNSMAGSTLVLSPLPKFRQLRTDGLVKPRSIPGPSTTPMLPPMLLPTPLNAKLGVMEPQLGKLDPLRRGIRPTARRKTTTILTSLTQTLRACLEIPTTMLRMLAAPMLRLRRRRARAPRIERPESQSRKRPMTPNMTDNTDLGGLSTFVGPDE